MSLVEALGELLGGDRAQGDRLAALSGLLLDLKTANREACLQLKDVKRAAQVERTRYDELAIALQSAQYERLHLESEIKDCQAYPSPHEALSLVPLEVFAATRMSDGDEPEHELMLARLQDELQRRKAMLEDVKLAELRRDAEKDRVAKLLKELEGLRDHAKTIYKMAHSYKLVSFAAAPAAHKSALLRLSEELQAYARARGSWAVSLVPDEHDEHDEDGAVAGDDDEDKPAKSASRHAPLQQSAPRRFAHAYVEAVPDGFDGAVLFYHAVPSDTASPVLLSVRSPLAEDAKQFLASLPIDASMLLCAADAGDPKEDALAFRWVQSVAGLCSDLSFADSQRCFAAFFEALAKAESPGPAADSTMDTALETMESVSMETSET